MPKEIPSVPSWKACMQKVVRSSSKQQRGGVTRGESVSARLPCMWSCLRDANCVAQPAAAPTDGCCERCQ